MLKAVFSAFKWEYLWVIFICLLSAALNYMSPFLIHMILTFIQSPEEDSDTAEGLALVAALVFS